jgi:DNA-binding CsgD family transcriptional regulator
MAALDSKYSAQTHGGAAVDGSPSPADGNSMLTALTHKQRQVFLLLGEGKTCAEIARALLLARSTVTLHKRGIMRRLGIPEQAALVRAAVLLRSTWDLTAGSVPARVPGAGRS